MRLSLRSPVDPDLSQMRNMTNLGRTSRELQPEGDVTDRIKMKRTEVRLTAFSAGQLVELPVLIRNEGKTGKIYSNCCSLVSWFGCLVN